MMNLYDDYAAFTEKTAIYPQQVAAEYLALGLCSESAECVELMLLNWNHNGVSHSLKLGAETGDIQWYAARLAVTYDFQFSEIVDAAKLAYKTTVLEIDNVFSRISVEAGLIAGKIKKQLRDGHDWTGEQREDARRYVYDRLVNVVLQSMYATDWMYRHAISEYGSYDKVLAANRAKLEGRLERGTLSGSGDAR